LLVEGTFHASRSTTGLWGDVAPAQAASKRDRARSKPIRVREGGCRDSAVPAEALQKNDRAGSHQFQLRDDWILGRRL